MINLCYQLNAATVFIQEKQCQYLCTRLIIIIEMHLCS